MPHYNWIIWPKVCYDPCDWCTLKTMWWPSEHAQPPNFYLPWVNLCVRIGILRQLKMQTCMLHWELSGMDDSACMLPRELIWKGVAAPVCPPGRWYGRGWHVLYAPQGVDLRESGSTCMLHKKFIWEGVACPVCSPEGSSRIWEGVAPLVCSQGVDPWRGWLHLLIWEGVPHAVCSPLSWSERSSSTCMLSKELIWRGSSICMLSRKLIWKRQLRLYAPSGSWSGRDSSICMLPR